MPATVSSRKPIVMALAASSIVYAMTRNSPTLNAISGPTICLAWAYSAAGGGDGRRHLRIDHGDASVEQARHPARHQARDHAAFADGEVPAHVFADQHDADAESPDMARPQHAQQLQALALRLAGRCGCNAHRGLPQSSCRSAVSSSSPSQEDVRSSLS